MIVSPKIVFAGSGHSTRTTTFLNETVGNYQFVRFVAIAECKVCYRLVLVYIVCTSIMVYDQPHFTCSRIDIDL